MTNDKITSKIINYRGDDIIISQSFVYLITMANKVTIVGAMIMIMIGCTTAWYNYTHYNHKMTQAHEVGHAQAIQTRTKTPYPTYIILYKDGLSWSGYTTNYSMQILVNDKRFDDIKIIANAGKVTEYENLTKCKIVNGFYKCIREFDSWSCETKEGEDSYYRVNPQQFHYLSIHEIIKRKNDIIDNRKSKAELYLYENNEMQKIKYKKDLPELNTNYKFEFIRDKENSFDLKF